MNRQDTFNRLWDFLVDQDDTLMIDQKLLYNGEDMYIELRFPGQHYELEVYIESTEGFTCVDIEVIMFDIEDHDWCWKHLNKLGLIKDELIS